MTNLMARCTEAAGSHPAGNLLMRIAFWMPKAKITIGGHRWVANSAAQWCAQAKLSPQQYKDAIARLRRLGLVITEQHLFGRRNITHVRLTCRGMAIVAPETPADKGLETPAQKGLETPLEKGLETPLNRTGSIYYELPQVALHGVLAHAVPGTGKDKKRIPGEKEGQMHPRKPYTTKDIPAGGSPKPGKAVTKLHQPDKVSSLEAVWKQTLAEVTEGWVVGLTIKQKGQLKHFMQACPPGTATDVLRNVLQDWVTFALEAQADGGIKSSPDQPEVGFLLKYVSTAVRLHLEATQPKQALGGKPASVAQVPAPVQLTAEPKPVDDYQPATKAEMMAILGIEPIPELPQKPGGAKPSKPSQKGTP